MWGTWSVRPGSVECILSLLQVFDKYLYTVSISLDVHTLAKKILHSFSVNHFDTSDDLLVENRKDNSNHGVRLGYHQASPVRYIFYQVYGKQISVSILKWTSTPSCRHILVTLLNYIYLCKPLECMMKIPSWIEFHDYLIGTSHFFYPPRRLFLVHITFLCLYVCRIMQTVMCEFLLIFLLPKDIVPGKK